MDWISKASLQTEFEQYKEGLSKEELYEIVDRHYAYGWRMNQVLLELNNIITDGSYEPRIKLRLISMLSSYDFMNEYGSVNLIEPPKKINQ